MFLHVGNNKNIRKKEIIGIFDADTATVSVTTRRFLSKSDKRGEIEAANEEIPKSFILYRKKEGYGICFSQISTSALLGRSEQNG
ncbi:MAG: DUF370 domain-containing protein [Clostridia bacterium]|nr:DUF370 domain-containing protein [Clostridia bacterium]MBR2464887.1 DUF370 domain-containing protein [Clostridia bacterium]MBR3862257.1 DUF370 domain-containing protein [Clostridia bacterium]